MLKLVNITKDYKVADTTVHALKGVSLEFRSNEFVSVLGASGCGKTTLLNIIGGLDHYTSGDMSVLGKSTKHFKDADWDVYRNHRIGFIFQSYNLIPHQNVLSNVEMALTIAGISAEERKRRAEEALIRVGLKDHLYKKPNQLSGGQAQRVAIARALVNNPEILLADEPTGALDSETSVQIMDLIKEISGERLVIMVTHNPELAEKYSTRIVRLSDGLVISDSNPYDGSSEAEELASFKKSGKAAKKEKASMSFFTALKLSAKNLVSKKGRTAVTAVAGSIGIIGVSLVLAISAGINEYIDDMQQDMLSAYPVTVSETSMDFSSILDGGTSMNKDDIEHLDDRVYVNSMLTSIAGGVTVTNDITEEYISYVKAMPEEYCYDVQFGYGNDVTNNIYTSFTDSSGKTQTISLSALYTTYQTLLMRVEDGKYQSLAGMLSMLGGVTHELPDNKDYILSQYDVIGEYPSAADEVAVVINGNGELSDVVLAQLGFFTQDEFMDYAEDSSTARSYFTDEEVLGKEYTYYPNDSIYSVVVDEENDVLATAEYSAYMDSLNEEDGVKLKITAILQVKDGINYGALSTGLNYTAAFTEKYMEDNAESEIAEFIKSAVSPSISYSYDFTYDGTTTKIRTQKSLALREVGGNTLPNSISFYSVDFESKDLVTDYLDEWNDEHENATIKYTDTLALIISMVKTMMNAVTYALVAFTAISLVVSTVMIGVITYVSVVERTKEIGILRALGARKKDIKHLFNAETFIIGLAAGLFGIGVTYLLSIPINVLIAELTGIAAIAALPYYEAVIMVVISICLTLISGLFPASAAARRDPVVALRTE